MSHESPTSSPLSIQETERLLAEAERLLDGITPTPWAWESIAEKSNEFAVGQAFREDGTPLEGRIAPWMQKDGHYVEDVVIRAVVGMNESGHANFKDAEFIAAAPRIVRTLLAALTSQTQARKAERLIADILEERADELDKAACDRCEQCGPMMMCSFHSVLSSLQRHSGTCADVERDNLRRRAEKAERQLAEATQARTEAEQKRDDALAFMERRGYRRCDTPACNCPFWHGGHAEARLSEIGESLRDAGVNGGTIHGGVLELIQAKELAEQQLSTETQARAEAEQQRDLYLRSLKMLSESMALAHDSQSGE